MNFPILSTEELKDPEWEHHPDIKQGMSFYLGFNLSWPDGAVCGTICVLDVKENRYSDTYKELVLRFKELIETDLALLYRSQKLRAQQQEDARDVEEKSQHPKHAVNGIPPRHSQNRACNASGRHIVESRLCGKQCHQPENVLNVADDVLTVAPLRCRRRLATHQPRPFGPQRPGGGSGCLSVVC